MDSDFPPSSMSASAPSAQQGTPEHLQDQQPYEQQQQQSYPGLGSPPSSPHKRGASSGGVANKLFGRLSGFTHAIQGVADQDPERARRDALGKTKESLSQLEQALEVAQHDVRDASSGVLTDLKRFQAQKEEDLRAYMVSSLLLSRGVGKRISFAEMSFRVHES